MVVAQHGDEHAAGGKQEGTGGVDRGGTGDKDHAAQRRPANDSRLHAGRAEGHGARQHGRRHQNRGERLLRGHLEGAGHTQHDGHRQQQFARGPAVVSTPAFRGGDEDHRHRSLRDQAARDDAAAVHAISNVPRHQRQQQRRRKLVQADQPQVPGAARQLVHLPAHRHHQHLVAGSAENPGEPHAHEGALVGEFFERMCRHAECEA